MASGDGVPRGWAWCPVSGLKVLHAGPVATVGDPGRSTGENTEKRRGPSDTDVSKGFSAFLASVFEQLSLSSWLPAVFMVGNVAVLLALQGQTNLSLTAAVEALIDLNWGALIVILFAVVISAMIIQAFEFEALRFWEGYLRSAVLGRWARRRIHVMRDKRDALREAVANLGNAAFDEARRRVVADPDASEADLRTWNVLEKVNYHRKLAADERLLLPAAQALNWPKHADPADLHAWRISKLKLAEFPANERVLPTRLGNVMRAAEDQVELEPNEDLEGFMIRHIDELPTAIVAEHAAYRKRIDMYCGLMFVTGFLAVMSVVCLWGSTQDLGWRIVTPLAYLALSWVCYKAAIASALGFGQALKEASAWHKRRVRRAAQLEDTGSIALS